MVKLMYLVNNCMKFFEKSIQTWMVKLNSMNTYRFVKKYKINSLTQTQNKYDRRFFEFFFLPALDPWLDIHNALQY